MPTWDCYNKRGEWIGMSEGDTEEEAIKNAAADQYLNVEWVEAVRVIEPRRG